MTYTDYQELALTQKQKHTLTLAMRQSLHMLQLNNIELRSYIEELIAHNAVVELAPLSDKPSDHLITFRESRAFAFRHGLYHEVSPISKEQLMRDKASSESLIDEIKLQISSQNKDSKYTDILFYLVDNLNDDGYLTASPKELAEHYGISYSLMNKAIDDLKTLDPAGIGASDLKECLMLQLCRLYDSSSNNSEIIEYALALLEGEGLLERLSRHQYREIALRLGIRPSQAEQAGDLIRTLNPRPFNGRANVTPINYITPDIYIFEDNGSFVCEIDSYYLPKLIIHYEYQDLPLSDAEISFIKKDYEEANKISHFLEYRVSTLQKIIEYAVRVQAEFFLKGPGHRTALSNRKVAKALGLSESTISRAVNEKYFECHWGIYPLKYLFSHSICTGSSNESYPDTGVDYDKAVSALKELIQNESPSSPLSDQKLSELLAAKDITISRRTVAKYRQQLKIPISSQRHKT